MNDREHREKQAVYTANEDCLRKYSTALDEKCMEECRKNYPWLEGDSALSCLQESACGKDAAPPLKSLSADFFVLRKLVFHGGIIFTGEDAQVYRSIVALPGGQLKPERCYNVVLTPADQRYGWLTGTWKEMVFPPLSEEIIREKADDIPLMQKCMVQEWCGEGCSCYLAYDQKQVAGAWKSFSMSIFTLVRW
ncbi:hypothetical protein IMY05_018G0072100 [Salix suchowensis]|nr:hypothetical protein IMY05_018G0072100 [Salix suchowensis]